jgi:predicted transposase YbfD/YdcC
MEPIMSITEAQARRAVRGLEFEWDEAVKDPRSARNQRHGHLGVMSALAAAFACGLANLRRVEDFTDDLPRGTRRRWGLQARVSDTTLYRVLSSQGAAGMRQTVQRQVRRLIEQKVVRHDELFAYGVLSLDGKCCWSSTRTELAGTKTSTDPTTGLVTSSLSSLRAVLTSSSVRPCLDMEVIAAKSGESPALRALLPRVCERFGGQFSIVTVDAGMTARENALAVLGQGKHYLMALKGNQAGLHRLVVPLFAGEGQEPRRCAAERRNGASIYRELYTVKVENLPDEVRFPGATELWCVRQFAVPDQGTCAKETTEVRYFISSMPAGMLNPTQKLGLVRLHWGIENGHHWTLDVPMQEDAVQPCQASRSALEVVAWLRVIAFNLISAWRTRRSSVPKLRISWRRAMEQLRDAILHPSAERYLATLG